MGNGQESNCSSVNYCVEMGEMGEKRGMEKERKNQAKNIFTFFSLSMEKQSLNPFLEKSCSREGCK